MLDEGFHANSKLRTTLREGIATVRLNYEQIAPEQTVWLLLNEQIAPFKAVDVSSTCIVLKNFEAPAKYMPYNGKTGALYGSEKDARVALIKIFEEDLNTRTRRLASAKAALNQLLRALDTPEP